MAPYTNDWDEAIPPGTAPAKDIDLFIRDSKLNVRERLETKLIVDMTEDPVVLQDAVARKHTGLKILISFADFVGAGDSGNNYENSYMLSRSDFGALVAPVNFPKDAGAVTLTALEVMLEKSVGIGSITVYLRRRAFASGGARDSYEDVASVEHSAANVAVTASAVLDIAISDDYLYWLYMDPSASADPFYVFGARLTIDTAGIDPVAP